MQEEFGDLHFSDELDRERKKRDTTKEDKLKLKNLKTKLKGNIKNLKQQIKEEKRKYLTEKRKNNKERRAKSNIEIIPTVKSATESRLKNTINQVNSEENMIKTSEKKMILNRRKRFVDTHSINLEENEIDDGNSIVKGGRDIDDLDWRGKESFKESFKNTVEKEIFTVKPTEPVKITENSTKLLVDPNLEYLRKVLGSNKAEYIEKFVGKIQDFGSKVKQFFSKLL